MYAENPDLELIVNASRIPPDPSLIGDQWSGHWSRSLVIGDHKIIRLGHWSLQIFSFSLNAFDHKGQADLSSKSIFPIKRAMPRRGLGSHPHRRIDI